MGRFLLITTGGTIASTAAHGGFAAELKGSQLLSGLPLAQNIGELTVADLFCMPSPQIGPSDWLALASYIAERGPSFDGVLVLHGTDTMAYTAAALSFLLLGFPRPVALTGAMRAPSEPDADGPANIADALISLKALAEARQEGVWLVFGGRILCAAALKKRSYRSLQGFETPALPWAGTVNAGRVCLDEKTLISMRRRPLPGLSLEQDVNPRVLGLTLHPGLTSATLMKTLSLANAFVLESYGSGGGPAEGDCETLGFLDAAAEAGAPVINVTPCTADGMKLARYHNGVLGLQHGLISGGSMTFEAALVKAMWLLPRCQDPASFKRAFQWTFCGEGAEERP